jgi:hypothetical protein
MQPSTTTSNGPHSNHSQGTLRLTKIAYKSRVPFLTKVMAAWGILGSSHPELSTFLLINPSSDVSEIFVRVIGGMVAKNTGYYFSSLLATELATKWIPGKVKNLTLNKQLSTFLQQQFETSINFAGLCDWISHCASGRSISRTGRFRTCK